MEDDDNRLDNLMSELGGYIDEFTRLSSLLPSGHADHARSIVKELLQAEKELQEVKHEFKRLESVSNGIKDGVNFKSLDSHGKLVASYKALPDIIRKKYAEEFKRPVDHVLNNHMWRAALDRCFNGHWKNAIKDDRLSTGRALSSIVFVRDGTVQELENVIKHMTLYVKSPYYLTMDLKFSNTLKRKKEDKIPKTIEEYFLHEAKTYRRLNLKEAQAYEEKWQINFQI